MPEVVVLSPARYVTVELAATMHGLSPGAIRKRIERGQWVERREFFRPPDGRVWICLPAVAAEVRRSTRVRLLRQARRKRGVQPQWADTEAIRAIYAECARISRTTGIEHEVDHIIPIRGKHVSGLHIETNLQILPRLANQIKGNRFDV